MQDPIFPQAIKFLHTLLEKYHKEEGTISQETKLRIENYLFLFILFKEATHTPTNRSMQLMIAEALTAIQEEVTRRVEDDKKYAEARFKLEALQRDAWYLRYSDYFTAEVDMLDRVAMKFKREASSEPGKRGTYIHHRQYI